MGVERRSLTLTLESRKLTAYHEGGHALVALKTQGASPIHKATIVPRGHALGMVTQVPRKDEYSVTQEQMLASIDVCMGGKVAEELIFGSNKVTSGATSDLKQATRLARHMVADCGMSDLIGPMHVETLMDEGRSGGPLREQVDQEVGRILRESYQRDIHAVLDGTFNPASPGGSPPAEGGSVKGGEANEDGMGSEAIPAAASLAAASGLAPPCA
eukprot:jgi/Tetstr1/421860/TSEL_012760.t1